MNTSSVMGIITFPLAYINAIFFIVKLCCEKFSVEQIPVPTWHQRWEKNNNSHLWARGIQSILTVSFTSNSLDAYYHCTLCYIKRDALYMIISRLEGVTVCIYKAIQGVFSKQLMPLAAQYKMCHGVLCKPSHIWINAITQRNVTHSRCNI